MIRVGVQLIIRDREGNTNVFVGVQLLHLFQAKVVQINEWNQVNVLCSRQIEVLKFLNFS